MYCLIMNIQFSNWTIMAIMYHALMRMSYNEETSKVNIVFKINSPTTATSARQIRAVLMVVKSLTLWLISPISTRFYTAGSGKDGGNKILISRDMPLVLRAIQGA